MASRGETVRCRSRRGEMFRAVSCGLLLAFCLFTAAPAFAQDTATLTGTVTDGSGAVVVNASVTAINLATNFETATVTNNEGFYRITFLRPGDYRVRITAAGF